MQLSEPCLRGVVCVLCGRLSYKWPFVFLVWVSYSISLSTTSHLCQKCLFNETINESLENYSFKMNPCLNI